MLASIPAPLRTFALLAASNAFMLDVAWAGLCMVGAVYFVFRSP